MRTITKECVKAFMSDVYFKNNNTEVFKVVNKTQMYLHGNLIAENVNGKIRITNAGWTSNVTKERLNGLPGVSISQVKGQWFLNGNAWDGKWADV